MGACELCTFINAEGADVCEMCGFSLQAKRPRMQSPPAEPPVSADAFFAELEQEDGEEAADETALQCLICK